MNFKEAMEKLESGCKISRPTWNKTYLQISNGALLSFEPSLTHFIYDNEIFFSKEWVIINKDDSEIWDNRFTDIVPELQKGLRAKLCDWQNDHFISLDKGTNSLVYHCTIVSSFVPDFASLIAQDWIEL